jgi:putative DNA primase/helicase
VEQRASWRTVGDVFEDVKWSKDEEREEACESVGRWWGPRAEEELRAKLKAFFILREAQPRAEIPLPASAPYEIARVFANRRCRDRYGVVTLWFWQGQWWRWNGRCFGARGETELRKEVYEWLDGSKKFEKGGGGAVAFNPTPQSVTNVIDGLKAVLGLEGECQPPMWLDTREEARDVLVFRNGAVNVLTGEMVELGPRLWVHSALDFDWDEGAECPVWEKSFGEMFPGDEESQDFLEEWLGYCMTEETKFQKAAAFVGVSRSGKSTIAHVLERLVGPEGYVGLSFHTWIKGEHSTQRILGKKVGVFPDVRLKPPKQFGNASFDPGGLDPASAELLLGITGEDRQSIARKFTGAWEGKLRLRVTLVLSVFKCF